MQRGHEVCLRGAGWVWLGLLLLLLRSWGMHSQLVSVLQMTLETKRLTAELGQKKDELAMTNDM